MCTVCHNPACMPDPERIEALLAEIEDWRAARKALATGVQEYTIGSRQLKRLSLKDIQKGILYAQDELNALCMCYGSGMRVMTGIPRDNL